METLEGNASTPVLPNQEDDEVQLMKEALIGGLGYMHKLGERVGVSLEGGYSKGKTVQYSYCDVWQFRDGKMSGLTAFVIEPNASEAD